MFRFPVARRGIRPDQGLLQYRFDRSIVAHQCNGQVLLIGAKRGNLVLLECRLQCPVHVGIIHVIQQQFLVVDGDIQLVVEGNAHRCHASGLLDVFLQSLDLSGFGRDFLVSAIEFGYDVGFSGIEEFLKDGFRRSEGYDSHRIMPADPLTDDLLQRLDLVGLLRLEVQFGFRDRKFPLGVQQELLLSDIGCVSGSDLLGFFHQGSYAAPVLVEVDVFIPFQLDDEFVLVDLRHPAFRNGIE